jgi:hypothetical protein
VYWVGVEINAGAAAAAAKVLDAVLALDLERCDLRAIGQEFDVIVIGDLLEHLAMPEDVLSALHCCSNSHTKIVCCLPNMAHFSIIERLVCGDISYDKIGLLDETHRRFFSPASAIKAFLDSGWLPDLVDEYRVEPCNSVFSQHVVAAAAALGVPQRTSRSYLGLYQMIFVCHRWLSLYSKDAVAPFSVIVPVNRKWQYDLNVARSPGLTEVGAQIVVVEGAATAADAYERGASKATHPWRVFVHQDVYFAKGTGIALSRALGDLGAKGANASPIGFAGIAGSISGSPRSAGLVIDRTRLFSHGESSAAISMDELAVVLHRNTKVKIDPALGWHLWATDLCLQALESPDMATARLLEIPLFHNSTNDFQLPPEFARSAKRLLKKHSRHEMIPTLCGLLQRKGKIAGWFNAGVMNEASVKRTRLRHHGWIEKLRYAVKKMSG